MQNKIKSEKITVNSIFREYAQAYRAQKPLLSDQEKKVMNAIELCRTNELGGRIEVCDNCGHTVQHYHSCRNRHCPQCQFMKKEQWIQDKKNDILPFQYFHVVFTIPAQLNPIVIRNKQIIYNLLFSKTKETLLSVTEDDKYFGAKIGFFAILHTWGQKLQLHPHIHCAVPGGGYVIKNNKKKWKEASENYLVPIKVLKLRFRSLFLTGLKNLFKSQQLDLTGTDYENDYMFQRLIDRLFKTEWVVYLKESFRTSDSVIEYLARYTHRIAISNYRIINVKDDIVSFIYKDYKENNKKKIMKLHVFKFIDRFLLHVLPYRYVRIRYFGLLSNRSKKKNIEECYDFYDKPKKNIIALNGWAEILARVTGIDPFKCPACKTGNMAVKEVIMSKRTRASPL